MTAIDSDVESPPAAPHPFETLDDEGVGRFRQPRIGVQEEQYLAPSAGGTRVHLRRPATPCRDDEIGKGCSAYRRSVLAGAIDHDHLRAALAQRFERRERARDPVGFIDDDPSKHNRTMFGVTPAASCSSALSCWCVVDEG